MLWLLVGLTLTANQCVMPQEAISFFYQGDSAAGYGYFDDDAQNILKVLTGLIGQPPGNPVTDVYVGLDLNDMSTDFFLFDKDECRTAHFGPVDIDTTIKILGEAGAAIPFTKDSHITPEGNSI